MPYRSFTRSTLVLALYHAAFLHTATWAASPVNLPDAGQSLRELQKLRPPQNPSSSAPTLHIDSASAATSSASQVLIPVEKIVITGNTLFPETVLLPLVAELIGSKHRLAKLESGARRISQYYHEQGYPVARAYLPAQDIKDGTVTIAILEGQLGQIKVNNQSRLSDERANDFLSPVSPKEVIQSAPIDRALLLLSDTPGVSTARATLQPGASVGSSDLLIELKPSTPFSAQTLLDNYGNRYTGQTRIMQALTVNSPFKLGDQLNVNVLASEAHLTYGRVAWQVPVGHQGLTLGAAYAGTRYRLGKDFSDLDAYGSATIGSLIASYPILRSVDTNLSGTFSLEDKHLLDHIDSTTPATRSNKHLKQVNLGVVVNHQDTLGQGGMTKGEISLSHGRLSFDGDSDDQTRNADILAQTQGEYNKVAYSVDRLQRITPRHSVSLHLAGQFTDHNLASSEKFSIAGANNVRAFAEGEATGDEGWLGSVAWNYALCDRAQASIFYDAGGVKINHSPSASSTTDNRRTLSGIGVGMNVAVFSHLQLKAALAWRTNGESNASPDHLPRLWLQGSFSF